MYWWYPDTRFTFLQPAPVVMRLPGADAQEQASGVFKTGKKIEVINKLIWKGLESVDMRVYTFVKDFAFSITNDVGRLVSAGGVMTGAGRELSRLFTII